MILQFGKTRLKLSFSFVALTALMIIICEERIVISSLLSSFIHEFGHLFFMYISQDVPCNVEFTLFGMRIDKKGCANISYEKEIIIALGGIIFNILSAFVSFIVHISSNSEFFLVLTVVNLIVAVVNSFPVAVLDCGRAIRYALIIKTGKENSEKYTDFISKIFVFIFTIVSLVYFIVYGINISLFAINIYLVSITIIKKWS